MLFTSKRQRYFYSGVPCLPLGRSLKNTLRPASFAAFAALVLAAPVWAANAEPTVRIVAPAMGAGPITTAEIPVTVAASNFDVECKNVGRPAKSGRGHDHVTIDGMTMAQMTNLYCTNSFAISGAGIKSGEHTLAVVVASDDQVNVGKPAMTKFVYQPMTSHQLPKAQDAQKPVVTILSPQNGTTVGQKVDVRVAVSGFDLSCDLEGKPDVTSSSSKTGRWRPTMRVGLPLRTVRAVETRE